MLQTIAAWYSDAPPVPGSRIGRLGSLAPYLAGSGPLAELASRLLGKSARPVRAIAFDKSPASNWALGWHQDRTINVSSRAQVDGFGPWTVKQGSPHVQPPIALIEAMLTIRIHLDSVTLDNGPLEIALGSHHSGYIAEQSVADVVAQSEVFTCLAEAGDVWVYATPILHASHRSTSTGQRRVLQVDYSGDTLPVPLEWALATDE